MTMRYAHLCPTALLKGAALLEQGRCNDDTLDTGGGVAIDDGVRDRSMPGVWRAFNTLTPDECPTVPGVPANSPAGDVQPDGSAVDDGGSVEPNRTNERDDVAESKPATAPTVQPDVSKPE